MSTTTKPTALSTLLNQGHMYIASTTKSGGIAVNVLSRGLRDGTPLQIACKNLQQTTTFKGADGKTYSYSGGLPTYIGPAFTEGSFLMAKARDVQKYCQENKIEQVPVLDVDPDLDLVLAYDGECVRLPSRSKFHLEADYFSPVFCPLTKKEYTLMYKKQRDHSSKFKKSSELSDVPPNADEMSMTELLAWKKKKKAEQEKKR